MVTMPEYEKQLVERRSAIVQAQRQAEQARLNISQQQLRGTSVIARQQAARQFEEAKRKSIVEIQQAALAQTQLEREFGISAQQYQQGLSQQQQAIKEQQEWKQAQKLIERDKRYAAFGDPGVMEKIRAIDRQEARGQKALLLQGYQPVIEKGKLKGFVMPEIKVKELLPTKIPEITKQAIIEPPEAAKKRTIPAQTILIGLKKLWSGIKKELIPGRQEYISQTPLKTMAKERSIYSPEVIQKTAGYVGSGLIGVFGRFIQYKSYTEPKTAIKVLFGGKPISTKFPFSTQQVKIGGELLAPSLLGIFFGPAMETAAVARQKTISQQLSESKFSKLGPELQKEYAVKVSAELAKKESEIARQTTYVAQLKILKELAQKTVKSPEQAQNFIKFVESLNAKGIFIAPKTGIQVTSLYPTQFQEPQGGGIFQVISKPVQVTIPTQKIIVDIQTIMPNLQTLKGVGFLTGLLGTRIPSLKKKEETKQKEITAVALAPIISVGPLIKEEEAIITKQTPFIQPKFKQPQIPIQPQVPIQIQPQIPILIQPQIPIQTQPQIPRQGTPQKPRTQQPGFPEFIKPIKPGRIIPKIPTPKKEITTQISFGGGLFTPEVRRYGLWRPFGKYPTLGEAQIRGVRVLRETLGAGLRIKKGEGLVPIARETFEFRPSKREYGVLIQKRRFRLGTLGERMEIQRARIMKTPRVRIPKMKTTKVRRIKFI